MNRISYDIEQSRLIVYGRDFYTCQYEGCEVSGYYNIELAHRIAKYMYKHVQQFIYDNYRIDLTIKEAKAVLNHPLNLVTSCHHKPHNSSFNIGNQKVPRDQLLKKIWETMSKTLIIS